MDKLSEKNKKELSELAKKLGIKITTKNTKSEIIELINSHNKNSVVEAKIEITLAEKTTTDNNEIKSKEIIEPPLPKFSAKIEMIGSEGYHEKVSSASYVEM